MEVTSNEKAEKKYGISQVDFLYIVHLIFDATYLHLVFIGHIHYDLIPCQPSEGSVNMGLVQH